MSYVSTQEQKNHGLSVDNQIKTLTAYCESNGLEVYAIYNDAGISGRKSYKNRPALLRMIEDCSRGVLDVVLFTALDRFTRSVSAYYSIVEQMNGVPWKAVLEDYDTTTSDGQLKLNLFLSIAQSEADRTSKRVKDIYTYRRARGDAFGRPPIGYRIEDKALKYDPDTYDGINAMFKTYVTTLSTSKALSCAASYGIHLEYVNFQRILKNPTYAGHTRYGHICPAYISDKEFDMIQAVKKSRKVSTKHQGRVYLFSGVLVCGYCGRRMAGKTRIQNGREYIRYVCYSDRGTKRRCPHIEIAEPKLEKYLLNHLNGILSDLRYKAEISDQGKEIREKEKKRLQGKIERLKDVYIEGDISKDEYQERKRRLDRELSAIPADSARLPQLPQDWKEAYNDLTKDRKQAFIKRTIKSITITNETKNNPYIVFMG